MCSRDGRNGQVNCTVDKPHSPRLGTVLTGTQFSNYPPLYFLVVGVPSLLATGSGALYGMQLTGALLDAALIALGLILLARYHPRGLPLLGAMVALSPMVLFVSAVVSASGMEVAAAFAAWCGGMCLVEQSQTPRSLAALTSLSFVVLILSRPDGPINAIVIILVLATLAGWRRSQGLMGEHTVRLIWIPVLVALVVAGCFTVFAGLPTLLAIASKQPRPSGLLANVWLTMSRTGGRLRECVGKFGWDKYPPRWVVAVWASALVGLFVFGLSVSRRCRRALPLLVLVILAMPVVLESPRINSVGPYWGGRYWLPLAVGLPLVASSVRPEKMCADARLATSTAMRLAAFACVGVLLLVAQVATFLTTLHRYAGHAITAGASVKWSPPGGTAAVVIMFIAGQILLLGFVSWRYHLKGDGSSQTKHAGEPVQSLVVTAS